MPEHRLDHMSCNIGILRHLPFAVGVFGSPFDRDQIARELLLSKRSPVAWFTAPIDARNYSGQFRERHVATACIGLSHWSSAAKTLLVRQLAQCPSKGAPHLFRRIPVGKSDGPAVI